VTSCTGKIPDQEVNRRGRRRLQAADFFCPSAFLITLFPGFPRFLKFFPNFFSRIFSGAAAGQRSGPYGPPRLVID
jgi:hypothetical protein